MSKARVAPLKKIKLPRLELLGALVAARIANHLKGIFTDLDKIVLWSDSTIVLHWIQGAASRWKPFVANRITEIQVMSDPSSWRYVISKDNPADMLTRGLSAKELINSNQWWCGPEWLSKAENFWPKDDKLTKSVNPEIEIEARNKIIVNATIVKDNLIDIRKYSNLKKLLRVTGYVILFIKILKKKREKNCNLTSEEIREAEIFWVKNCQNEIFLNEIICLKNSKPIPRDSKLLSLNPYLDPEGVLRVSGRLGKTNLSVDEKHPIILPPKTKLAELIIWDAHYKVFHSAVSHTLLQIRERFWLIRARQTVRSVLKNCIVCKRFSSTPGDQTIAPLPADRVEQANPFSVIGCDFAGPLYVKDSGNKQYILLITCAVTRNVHLELVDNLSTSTFLLGFRRFISRRGLPAVIYSDNAKTFKRAEKDLRNLWSIITHPDVQPLELGTDCDSKN